MRKLLVGVVGFVVLLVAAILILPSVVDLRPRIAAAVHDATGRELRIDGPLHIALLPKLRVSASGIHLSNAPGAAAPEMLSVDRVALEAELLPLLGRRLVIDSLVVEHPVVTLETDKSGRANWAFRPPGATPPPQAAAPAEGASPLRGLRLGKLELTQGRISYRNALTGQTVDAKDVAVTGAMAALESPLTLRGGMVLNDEPVTADLTVDTLGKLQRGQQADVKLALAAKPVTAKFDGTAQQRPVPGLNGVFSLDVPSVGKLLAWLKMPLAKGQPDPGPLQVRASFAAEGAKSVLKQATISGTGLDVKASGSVDASGSVTKVTAAVETGLLDIDRYLPPRAAPAPRPAAPAPGTGLALPGDPFAALPDRPFDLAPLRRLDADITLSVGGVKAVGYELGRVAFAATAKNGALAATLSQASLYGGTLQGAVKLDGAGDALGIDATAKADHVAIGRLAQAAGVAAPPVAGALSLTLDFKARGRSPRALAEDMRAHLAAALSGAAGSAGRSISDAKLNLDVPGADKASTLAASALYNGERVDATATLPPLRQLAGAGRFPAKLLFQSKPLTIRYDGSLQRKPIPGLDGVFDLETPSVGRLAAWAGAPLGARQPDPGPLKIHATLASDGSKLALKDAEIAGKALKASAHASFDGSQKPPRFDAKVDVQQADLDAYLPPPAEKQAAAPAAQAPAGWSAEPFDLAALGAANGKAEMSLAGLRYRGLDIAKGDIMLVLADRVLKLTAGKVALAQGTIDAAATLDASSGAAKLDSRVGVAGAQARPLLQAFAGTNRLGGTIQFQGAVKGSGRNQKELIASLDGSGSFKITDGAIYGINIAQTLRKAGSLGFGGGDTQKTDFAELSGTYTIKSGVIDNRDMKMLAPLLRLSGAGTVPMPPQTIDYAVEAKLVPTMAGQGGQDALAGIPIPIRIAGPWSNPGYSVDWKSVFSTIAADPARLKALPSDLGNAAKGFGVALPQVPGVGSSVPPQILKQIPGLPSKSTPGTPPAQQQQQQKPATPFGLPGGLFGK